MRKRKMDPDLKIAELKSKVEAIVTSMGSPLTAPMKTPGALYTARKSVRELIELGGGDEVPFYPADYPAEELAAAKILAANFKKAEVTAKKMVLETREEAFSGLRKSLYDDRYLSTRKSAY